MKKESKPILPPQHEETLLERLTETPITRLEYAVKSSEGFSQEDEASDKRGTRAELRKAKTSIQRNFFWFLFWLTCGGILVFAMGFVILLFFWVLTFWSDPLKLESFIFQTMWSVLLIFATLFFESVLKNRDD
jgi:hypothetical protein